MTVTFQFVGREGRFQVCDSEGKEVVVEAGKNYSTSDPDVIRELDQATHAVRRVKPEKED